LRRYTLAVMRLPAVLKLSLILLTRAVAFSAAGAYTRSLFGPT
jgi:hypothetical protein